MKKKRKNKGGEILVENVIFIIITLVFFSILVLFVSRQGSGGDYLEQSYAKQIALAIDSAKPGMSIFLDMQKASKEKWFAENFDKSVRIENNVVIVKLSEKGGHSYSFFNDVNPLIEVYPKGGVSILIRN